MMSSTTAMLSIYDFGIDHHQHQKIQQTNAATAFWNQNSNGNSNPNASNGGGVHSSLSEANSNKQPLHVSNHHHHHSHPLAGGVGVVGHANNKPVADRMTGLFLHQHQTAQHHSHHNQPLSQLPYHSQKMSGGIRRTVSSAAAQSSSSSSSNGGSTAAINRGSNSQHQNSASSNTSSNKLLNTQPAKINGHHHHPSSKDPHKKLDRSYSEPAEKKQSQQQAQQNSLNGAAAAGGGGTSSRYKTELCRSYAEVGHCKYGDKCQFAHGDEELRTITRHPKFKTENCKSFHSTGFCPYGPRCHFIHNGDESKKNNIPANFGSNQRLFESNSGQMSANGLPLIGGVPFGSNHHHHVNNPNVVRPKALSLGSYSLGSSGEISSPSSQSGSPTSLNSFFTEDAFGVSFGAPSSRMSGNFPATNTFSFSPDSAFVAFNPSNNPSKVTFNTGNNSCQRKFFGSQPTINSSFTPEPTIADQTTNSVLSSLFSSGGGSPTPFNEVATLRDIMSSPIGKSAMLFYPTSPESPVDSVASEIEALKLGEQPTSSFSPISSSFSATSSMSASSTSPPNITSSHIDLDALAFLHQAAPVISGNGGSGPVVAPSSGQSTTTTTTTTNIPRLPTFAKMTTNSQNFFGGGRGGGGMVVMANSPESSSCNQSIESF